MAQFALVGNPNSGKTTLFNALTGSTAHVGNWPGVTVDKREGTYKKLEEPVTIVDLPGIYSLSPYTPEEVIARNFILDENPACVINIVDATNLERNLYLTTQIAEIDVPMVIALNMMDVIKKNGDQIDVYALEQKIGVPVVAISAQKGEGIDVLMRRAYEVSKKPREGKTVLSGSPVAHLIKDVSIALNGVGVKNPLFHAVKLVENDEIEVDMHKDVLPMVDEFKKTFSDETFGNDLEAVVADARYQYISKHYSKVKTKAEKAEDENLTKSDKIDKVLTNRWAGIPIFLVILFLVFHLTFSENLFWLGNIIHFPVFNEGGFFEGLFFTDAGINSPGVILFNFVDCCTAGLSDLVAGWMSGAPSWLGGFVVDGILAGVFSVLSFVPQILLLFLFFSILEDSGYMARVAFILDRIFRKFGLSGRAFMPMIMGFGCSVPAMINTRTLADENERTATIRVIPFFSCGAKLPILTAIAGGICQVFNFPNADLITYSMYLVGMVTAIVTIIIMRNTTMRGKTAPFIMELPAYHRPQVKALMLHLWDKLKHYVKKAFTIILASTIVIWFLQSFTWTFKYIEMADPVDITVTTYEAMTTDEEGNDDYDPAFVLELAALDESYVSEEGVEVSFEDLVASLDEVEEGSEDETAINAVLDQVFAKAAVNYYDEITADGYVTGSDSILASIGRVIQPIFTPVGFGSQLNKNGWVFGVSAVTGLIAKENVIATFGVLSQSISEDSITANKEITGEEFKDLYFVLIDDEGVSASVQMIQNTTNGKNTPWAILIAFIVFNMTTIPCFAAIATAKGELPSKKKFWFTLLFWIAVSYVVSAIAYLVLSVWWTSFIVAALFAALIFGLYYYNKSKDEERMRAV
ncbi:MAG: ferrous iron transporter B [Acholeplasmatales bacterium]|nr:ferrous iron transporter B [Acholeplasmatales bacterium]